jgi:DNA topoisomerase-1
MDVFLKKGQFGLFITWGENSKSINTLNKLEIEIVLEDIIHFLNSQKIISNNANLIRKLNANLSIKNGKYGDYIYYKTNSMTKPKFLDLKKFAGDYKTAEINILVGWISDMHNISV